MLSIEKKSAIAQALIILLICILCLPSCKGLDRLKKEDNVTVTGDRPTLDNSNANNSNVLLESKDSTVFMPVIRELITNEPSFSSEDSGRTILHLKRIFAENENDPLIKDPVIQSLCIYMGDMETFVFLSNLEWNKLFFDSGQEDWKDNWSLDGLNAEVKNSLSGMDFYAGPVPFSDAHHAVLWTKQFFSGDLIIEYDYTRLDEQSRFVNIIYIQATGSEIDGHHKDIAMWADKREVAAMKQYFNNMFLYHISYSVFTEEHGKSVPGYIRTRRYMAGPLQGTEIEPDYSPEGLFETDIPHKIKIIKTDRHLFMKINTHGIERLCHWYNTEFPAIREGYIGLRHMNTRKARYADFTVFGN